MSKNTTSHESVLLRKYNAKKLNAKYRKIPFTLTLKQYSGLLKYAGITANDIGRSKYHLSRKNDTGGYTYGNCKFKPYLENLLEKRISDKSRKASSRNIRKAHEKQRQSSLEDISNAIKASPKFKLHIAKRKEEAIKRRADFVKSARQLSLGYKNSQFGTFWITDGSINHKWSSAKGKILKGFRRGRSI